MLWVQPEKKSSRKKNKYGACTNNEVVIIPIKDGILTHVPIQRNLEGVMLSEITSRMRQILHDSTNDRYIE